VIQPGYFDICQVRVAATTMAKRESEEAAPKGKRLKSAPRAEPAAADDAATAAAAAATATLYIKNLNDQIRIKALRHLLYLLFATYGDVLEIVLNYKRPSMRGQAHVVFADVEDSAQALSALQGFDFFGKPMRIEFAKRPSRLFEATAEE
jgi:RNA recognition motif-containing protein